VQHPNQCERDACAVTLVTSLIADCEPDTAARLATACVSGAASTCMNLTCNGVSFHRLALDWLAAQTGADRGKRP
jgi:hypothetical protein